MAIYRKGTASVDASGKMTGTGTEWMQALSLIRVGATVILLSGSKPVIGSIAEIISDTEINLIGTDSQTAAYGDYVILLSDSLTVDGLAQDIAETLRYYQGKESAIDGLIDSIEGYLNRAESSANASEVSRQESAASASEAARQVALASDQVALASDQVLAAKYQADSAAGSASSSHASATQASDSAQLASTKASESASSQAAASVSADQASTSATAAKDSEVKAKQSADSASATLSASAMKAQNLNDLQNKSTAWANLLTARTAASARSDLGLGNSATRDVGLNSGSVAAGDDSRLNTVDSKTGGIISSGLTVDGAFQSRKIVSSEVSQSSNPIFSTIFTGTIERARLGLFVGISSAGERVGQLQVGQDGINKTWIFSYTSGSATAPGQWINGSDRRFKTNIKEIEDPLGKMRVIKGCTWERLDFDAKGIGFIAQDVIKVFPDSVYDNFAPVTLKDGTVLENTYSVDTSGVSAALHHQAILALMDKIELMEKRDLEKDILISDMNEKINRIIRSSN